MPRKMSRPSDEIARPAPDAPAPDDAPDRAPVPAAPPLAATATLDDVAALLVQLEPADAAELEQVRAALVRLARATDDFDAACALGGAATQVAAAIAGADADARAAAFGRASRLVETAMTQLAALDAGQAVATDDAAPSDEDADAEAAMAAALAGDPVWAEAAVADVAPAPAPRASRETAPEDATMADDEHQLPDDIDVDLLRDFIVESRDCISSSEAALLALEHDPSDDEAINTVFRAFHTIKGTAGFMGLRRIAEFAHHAESLLSRVRDHEIEFAGPCADLSLRSADMIGLMLTAVEDALGGEPLRRPDGYFALMNAVIALESGEAAAAAPAAAAATAMPAAPEPPHDDEERRGGDRRQGDRRGGDRRAAGDRRADAADLSVRVRTERLDRLIDMVGELVIAQSMIAQDPAVLGGGDHALAAKVTHAGKLVRDLQELAMGMRMVPMKSTFQKLARLVRDLAQATGKQVELVTEGEDTEIDRNMVDVIGDPLVHMVRNALDHGLETPAERIAAGKSPTGRIRLSAYHANGSVVVDLQDDGRGLNRTRILDKARARGIVTSDKHLSDGEVFDLVFAPGFSTAEQITDISGRGVGMDVVKRNVESLRGKVEIASELGRGSTFSVRLPLTLAIADGMLVRVGAERYIVPTAAIHMSFRPERGQLSTVAGRGDVVLLRDELMPVVRVHRMLDVSGAVTDPAAGILMIVGDQERRTAVLVDELLGQHQLVVKSLGNALGTVPGISGAAILGDGRVGLILDVAGLVALARARGDEPVLSAA